jgi:PAS domain S-box-containing protein
MNADLVGCYDYRLVTLSVLIAVFAAYAALELAGRVTISHGPARFVWLYCGSVAMGTGIWATHYIGMEAFQLPVRTEYDWPKVVLSLVMAIIASALALLIVSRSKMRSYDVIAGSIFMGLGIAGIHFIGMAAMIVSATLIYSIPLVSLSVCIAIAASYIALRLAFSLRYRGPWSLRKIGGAAIMGGAISLMHYVAMAAVTFVPKVSASVATHHGVSVSTLGLASMVIITVLILMLVVLAVTVDRRLSEQSRILAESLSQLEAVFDNMADGIVVMDSRGRLLHRNQTAQRMLDLNDGEVGIELSQLYDAFSSSGVRLSPDEWPGPLATKNKFLQDEELTLCKQSTGRTVVTEVSATPVRNHRGEMTQVILSCRDITERKRNIEARARLAAIVDSSEDAIIGKDKNGVIQSWNAAAERIFGYTAEEIVGESILRLVPADFRQEEEEFLGRIGRGETVDPIETMRRRKDGRLINVSVTISPIRDSDGKVIGASKIARDITDRKQLERQLLQSQKMEAVGQLTGGIAHDFNNLLGVIIGNLSLLERSVSGDEKAARWARTSQKAAWRGADLIRRLLTFSTNETLTPSFVSTSEAVHNLVELATHTIGPEIAIIAQLDDDLPLVFVDSSALESALLNLAVNARDAMPQGGSLTIATGLKRLDEKFPGVKTGALKSGVYVSIALSDTGFGMSQEVLGRVFEPFFTTKPQGKGTGLGLAMVYGFTKQSLGAVRIYSEIGYGTTVTMYLPVADESRQNEQIAMPKVSSAMPGRKVLVVDDEVDLLEVACDYLEQRGYLTERATNGANALEVIAKTRDIDLIITEVIMPGGMNGVDLVKQIRESIPDIRVIYSSGFSADALAERDATTVDSALLYKPYQREDFEAAVNSAMAIEKSIPIETTAAR